MPVPYANALFWTAAAATAVAQILILRSTFRILRSATPSSRRFWEWVWAILPAVTLVVLFIWTWQTMQDLTAMHEHVRNGVMSTEPRT